MNQEKIGKFIAKCRANRNMTQIELAEKLNITDRAISKWENGRGLPEPSLMLELCKELDITVNELLSGEKIGVINNKEQEIKVINIDVENLEQKLVELGAKQTYRGTRHIYALDTKDREFLDKRDKLIRVTDANTVKVTMHINQSRPEEKDEIKYETNSLKDTLEFFHQMGIDPITKVDATRTSYKLGMLSFDIDKFPLIPPFLEIGIEFLKEEGYTIESLLETLKLDKNSIAILGTEDIHKLHGYDYFEEYKIHD